MLRQLKVIILLALLLGVYGSVIAQNQITPGPELFDGEQALQRVADYISVGPRPVGTPEIILAGNLILDYLDQMGWKTSEEWRLLNFGSPASLGDASRETLSHWNLLSYDNLIESYMGDLGHQTERSQGFVNVDQVLVPIRNLVASYGAGTKTILIGAHYDSRILADQDPDPEKRTESMPGANDGGSGVGVLLELARVIGQYYTTNDCEIRLVFFDAEDNGRIPPWSLIPWTDFSSGFLVGSILYADGLDLNTENIEYMILIDMVGDMDQHLPIEGYSNQVAPDLANAIWKVGADLGYQDYFVPDVRGPITDDHVPFIQQGIKAVDIIDLDYPYWHTTGDTLDKVSSESLERVGRVLQAFLETTQVIKRRN